jgi:hypothetical protein|tara:strand:- start:207 stop:356 length:150 start_codon:yes stop_codon:yes gene_type:complete
LAATGYSLFSSVKSYAEYQGGYYLNEDEDDDNKDFDPINPKIQDDNKEE